MYNTYGDNCQYCKPGYVGDATRGSRLDCMPTRHTSQQNVYYQPQHQGYYKPAESIYGRMYQPRVAYNHEEYDDDEYEDEEDYLF